MEKENNFNPNGFEEVELVLKLFRRMEVELRWRWVNKIIGF
jgi:hypothetical protein